MILIKWTLLRWNLLSGSSPFMWIVAWIRLLLIEVFQAKRNWENYCSKPKSPKYTAHGEQIKVWLVCVHEARKRGGSGDLFKQDARDQSVEWDLSKRSICTQTVNNTCCFDGMWISASRVINHDLNYSFTTDFVRHIPGTLPLEGNDNEWFFWCYHEQPYYLFTKNLHHS